MKQGLVQGREQGIAQGLKEGEKNKTKDFTLALIKQGLAVKQISLVTSLPTEEIESYRDASESKIY